MDITDIIKKPLVTEKTMKETVYNRYTFLVNPKASKTQIKNAVEEIFETKVKKVRTARQHGKMRQAFNQEATFESETKKAIVELEKGEKLDIYEK